MSVLAKLVKHLHGGNGSTVPPPWLNPCPRLYLARVGGLVCRHDNEQKNRRSPGHGDSFDMGPVFPEH
jgi:hypothetical protein